MQKNILITGVSSGIGHGLAKYYLKTGYHVYGVSRRETQIDSERFHFMTLDIAKFNQIQNTITTLLEGVTSLELVVLNAGILPTFGDMKETSLENIDQTMQVNVWSNKVLLDCLISHIPNIKQVIGISSGASQSGARGWNAYALSKATLNMLLSLYAAEEPHIHFSALAPGLVDTPMQDYLNQLEPSPIYPVLGRLQSAKGTPDMPLPDEAAHKLAQSFEKVLSQPSGEFADIRNLHSILLRN
ncbi:SDR family NAD(P)-dependent oxidoreductase [Candidatus Parabeggiatoa sp. HSG14]|uniref:SDR family NAD(P)-dependent oxidoreductase n=1 Tax=Candidatus Parabeggiatoa sp. HSG14 TaxID=3055593 RepID=UPI0025A7788B|nr:SDR family NAD(P)-dependent oxidoreductase [Thiotrichales bacterium HSG14]